MQVEVREKEKEFLLTAALSYEPFAAGIAFIFVSQHLGWSLACSLLNGIIEYLHVPQTFVSISLQDILVR